MNENNNNNASASDDYDMSDFIDLTKVAEIPWDLQTTNKHPTSSGIPKAQAFVSHLAGTKPPGTLTDLLYDKHNADARQGVRSAMPSQLLLGNSAIPVANQQWKPPCPTSGYHQRQTDSRQQSAATINSQILAGRKPVYAAQIAGTPTHNDDQSGGSKPFAWPLNAGAKTDITKGWKMSKELNDHLARNTTCTRCTAYNLTCVSPYGGGWNPCGQCLKAGLDKFCSNEKDWTRANPDQAPIIKSRATRQMHHEQKKLALAKRSSPSPIVPLQQKQRLPPARP